MSRPRLRPLRVALLAGLAAGLSGCAVLQIDVDVYKGPLANEEAVQIQQFAAMAIGAKPLLIQLRDNLQWRDPEEPDAVKAARKKARDDGWYVAGFVAPPLDEAWNGNADPAAVTGEEGKSHGFLPRQQDGSFELADLVEV